MVGPDASCILTDSVHAANRYVKHSLSRQLYGKYLISHCDKHYNANLFILISTYKLTLLVTHKSALNTSNNKHFTKNIYVFHDVGNLKWFLRKYYIHTNFLLLLIPLHF